MMYKTLLILLLTLSGCATGVVTIERHIPANMLRMCPDKLPQAPDGKASSILVVSVARTATYNECRDSNNALVDYLTNK